MMSILDNIQRIDTFMFMGVINSRHHRRLTKMARVVSHSADGYLYLPLAAFLYFYDAQHSTLFLPALLLAFLLERPLYLIMKNGFQRNRPAQKLQGIVSQVTPSDRFSFPSGHTSAAFLVATLLSFVAPNLSHWFYGWACMVGLSRVILGVHFPTDTMVGTGMGWSLALISLNLLH